VPDWVDPTTWVGSDNTPAPAPDQQTADNNVRSPDLSTIPDRPAVPSTADDQKQVAQSLAQDRAQTQYSADALKGGTEPAAAPPSAQAQQPTDDAASNDNAPTPPAPPPGPPAAGPGSLPAESAPATQASQELAPAPTTRVASEPAPLPAAAPAVPMSSGMPAVPAVGQQVAMSDSSLGFRPSSAPPLDGSVAQFVPPSILARYRQTAAISGGPAVPGAGDGSVYAQNSPSPKARSRRAATAEGGPEAMSGAVVANFDSLQGGVATAPASVGGYSGAPAASVYFPRDTTVLNEDAKSQVREAARVFLAQGGQGYVRVVGHSSSKTGSLSADRSVVWNFERSQARANAVARALIQAGVPADRVLVQAVTDGPSGYSDGGEGNRRADIYFQS
jgi:outer membrane protein OmpA-like peptidoglycan-associated protein